MWWMQSTENDVKGPFAYSTWLSALEEHLSIGMMILLMMQSCAFDNNRLLH